MTMTITNDVKKLESLYEAFNKEFYNNELEAVTITYKEDIKAYGYITTNKVWSKVDEEEGKQYEINISSNSINLGFEKVCGTLLHEMAHLYNLEHGIKDTSLNGYHNTRFKATAENHGLSISKHDKYGWTITELAPESKEIVEKYHVDFETKRHVKQERGVTKKVVSYKHVCPICGAIARTTKDSIHLVCGDCEVPMEIEN